MNTTSYATIEHLQTRYSERALRLMTDTNAQAVNVSVAQNALTDASAEIDTYLGQRYVLPLVATQSTNDNVVTEYHPALIRLACDIAVYRLQTLRPMDDIKDARQRYEDAIKLLNQMVKGDVLLNYRQLRDDVAPAENASAGMPMFGQPPSRFGRDKR